MKIKVESMLDAVHATKAHRPPPTAPSGVLVYMRTVLEVCHLCVITEAEYERGPKLICTLGLA